MNENIRDAFLPGEEGGFVQSHHKWDFNYNFGKLKVAGKPIRSYKRLLNDGLPQFNSRMVGKGKKGKEQS